MVAELEVSITDAPDWFKSSASALDLADDNVLTTIWENVMKIKVEAITEVQKQGQEAHEKLQELAKANEAK